MVERCLPWNNLSQGGIRVEHTGTQYLLSEKKKAEWVLMKAKEEQKP